MYKDKFSKTIGSLKLTWNLMNEFTGFKNFNDNSGTINSINNNGQCINVLNDPIAAANTFNNFFYKYW